MSALGSHRASEKETAENLMVKWLFCSPVVAFICQGCDLTAVSSLVAFWNVTNKQGQSWSWLKFVCKTWAACSDQGSTPAARSPVLILLHRSINTSHSTSHRQTCINTPAIFRWAVKCIGIKKEKKLSLRNKHEQREKRKRSEMTAALNSTGEIKTCLRWRFTPHVNFACLSGFVRESERGSKRRKRSLSLLFFLCNILFLFIVKYSFERDCFSLWATVGD